MSRSLRRLLVVAGVAAGLTALSALPAAAHVSVSSPGAAPGGFGVLTFRVPTESDTASTTGVKVQFPADQPLSFVSVKPKTGWTYTVTRAKLATPIESHGTQITDHTSVIEWKAAAGTAIKPGEFDEFQVSAGPLPEAEAMTFKAIQTYSDGEVVSWIEEPAAGSSEEPEYPAPTLKLTAAATDAGGGEAPAAAPAATDSDDASKGSVTGAYVLGGAGLLAGLAALALALTARRRPPTSTPAEPVTTSRS